MCGITGFVGPGDRDDLLRMTARLIHRGPDAEGYFIEEDKALYLGHRRLNVVDIAGGQQPMWNEDRTVCVIFNGEIYNHRDLRRQLINAGHVFRSDHSDTEVLVHGYEEWLDDLPRQLNGMFAFAIYDSVRARLFLARDQVGEKPLYYTHFGDFFGFASELPALAAHPKFNREFDLRALQKYFAYGFFPAPLSLFHGCSKLPPGSTLTYDLGSRELRERRYWRFACEPRDPRPRINEAELAEELSELIHQSVSRRIECDVPFGAFLSGGIDSSIVVTIMARLLPPSRVTSFTIGFRERSFDESYFARAISSRLGIVNHTEILSISAAWDSLPELFTGLGEPLGDASVLPTHLVSKLARKHATVALSGDGSDELFGGYDTFPAVVWARLYKKIVPRAADRTVRRLVAALPVSDVKMGFAYKLQRMFAGLEFAEPFWNTIWAGAATPEIMREIFSAALPVEELYEEALDQWVASPSADPIDKSLDYFVNWFLPDRILTKVDRTSMMASLEVRPVFLDLDLIEFCRRLPVQLKIKRGVRKYLLKKAISSLLPRAVLRRPKKGFSIPLSPWLRQTEFPRPAVSFNGLRSEALVEIWRQHREKIEDHQNVLWAWLCLDRIAAGYLNGAAPLRPGLVELGNRGTGVTV